MVLAFYGAASHCQASTPSSAPPPLHLYPQRNQLLTIHHQHRHPKYPNPHTYGTSTTCAYTCAYAYTRTLTRTHTHMSCCATDMDPSILSAADGVATPLTRHEETLTACWIYKALRPAISAMT